MIPPRRADAGGGGGGMAGASAMPGFELFDPGPRPDKRRKLTRQQAGDIRRRLAGGETGRALAAAYGVSPGLVSKIAGGRLWREDAGPRATEEAP